MPAKENQGLTIEERADPLGRKNKARMLSEVIFNSRAQEFEMTLNKLQGLDGKEPVLVPGQDGGVSYIEADDGDIEREVDGEKKKVKTIDQRIEELHGTIQEAWEMADGSKVEGLVEEELVKRQEEAEQRADARIKASITGAGSNGSAED